MPESSHPGAFFVFAQIPAAAVVGADALIGPYIFYRRFFNFHTPQVQSKALVDRRGPGEPFERFPRSLFSFARRFLFGEAKENAVRFPFFRKKGKNGFEKFVFLLKEKPKWER